MSTSVVFYDSLLGKWNKGDQSVPVSLVLTHQTHCDIALSVWTWHVLHCQSVCSRPGSLMMCVYNQSSLYMTHAQRHKMLGKAPFPLLSQKRFNKQWASGRFPAPTESDRTKKKCKHALSLLTGKLLIPIGLVDRRVVTLEPCSRNKRSLSSALVFFPLIDKWRI